MLKQPHTSLTLYPVTYDKKMLANAPEDECLVFFTLAQIANDIFMLQRATLIYLQAPEGEPKPIPFARTSTALCFAQILAGKLYEACSFLTRNAVHGPLVASYSREFPGYLEVEAREALSNITKFSNRESLLKRVRHKAAFHYDIEQTRSAYRVLPEGEPLTEYFAPSETNSFYGGASLLSSLAAMGATDESELKTKLDRLMDELLEVGSWVKVYVHAFMIVFFRRHVDADLESLLNKSPITLYGLPLLVDVHAPYFCIASEDDI
jgi:hypothetical protein